MYIYIISSYTHVGIELTPYGCNIKSVFKVNLLCCTFDLPARAAVMNINQFNGFFGCPRCLQEGSYNYAYSYFGFFIIILSGKSAKVGSRGTVRVYPYIEDNPTGPRRTHQINLDLAAEAATSGTVV